MSVRRVQFRRGNKTENDAFTGAIGEVTVNTTDYSFRIHDGTTAGGHEAMKADLSNFVLQPNATVDFTDNASNVSVRLVGVDDPTSNQDVATKAYVDTQVLTGGGGSLSIGSLSDVEIGGTGETAIGDAQIVIYDGSDGNSTFRNKVLSGDITITHNGVITISDGAITLGKIDIIANNAITNAKLANDTITIGTTGVALGGTSTSLAGMTAIDFANQDATIGANMTTNGGSKTVLTLGGAGSQVTIAGDLLVSGATTTLNTATLDVTDTVIRLNTGIATSTSANPNDIGLFFERGTQANDAIFFWDESEAVFKIGTTTVAPTEVDFGTSGLTFQGLELSALVASSTGEFGGMLTATAGINIGASSQASIASTGAITATNASSSFASGTTIGDITISNGSLSTSNASGTFDFNDDNITTRGDISTTGTGTLSITGTSTLTGLATLTGGATLGSNSALSIPKATAETTALIKLNSDTASGAGQNAVISVITGGASDATITWQHDESKWEFSHSVSLGTDLTVGQDLEVTRNASVGADLTIGDTLYIKSQPDNDLGIVFNSDRGSNNINNADYDVQLITVENGTSDATLGVIEWDDDQGSFVVDSGKLHSNTDFSVGTAIGTKLFTVAQATGNTSISGTLGVSALATLSGGLSLSGQNVQAVGTLSVDTIQSPSDASVMAISLDDNQQLALDIKEGSNSYLSFDTRNSGGEKIVFGKLFEAPSSSKIADITFGTGSITSTTTNLSFGANNLTTTGNITTTGSGSLNVAGTANLGTVEVTGVLSADGGLNVDDVFVVADTTGAISTTGDLTINSNKFVVTGSTGATDIAGKATLKSDLDIETTAGNGITFRSEIATGGLAGDANLIRVNDGGVGPLYKTLRWDTNPGVFDFSHALNSTGSLTVGTVGTPVATIDSSNGNTTLGGVLSIEASDLNNALQSATLILNSDVGTSQERNAIIEVERGGETNASITWNETNDRWELSNALRSVGDFLVGDGTTPTFTVDSVEGNTVISGSLAVSEATTFNDDINVVSSNTNGIIFNSDLTGDSEANNATMLTVERGNDAQGSALTDAIISWNETQDEFSVNSVAGLHLVGKSGSNALTVGGANSTSATAILTSAGALTISSLDISGGGLSDAGPIDGVTSIALDTITDSTADGIEIELADNTPSALLIRQGTAGESYITVNTATGSESLTLHQATSLSSTLLVTGETTLDATLNLKQNQSAGSDVALILANSDRIASGAQASAILLEIERGALTNAKFEWDETNTAFTFDNTISAESGLQVGANSASPTLSIDTTGNLSTSGSLTTSSVLNFSTASQGAIVFNSDLDVGNQPNVNDSFGLTVNRGALTDAILHWDEADDRWEFNNSIYIAGDISITGSITNLGGGGLTLSSLNLTDDSLTSLTLNSDLDNLTAPTADIGITVNRGSATDAVVFFDETTDQTWKINRGDGIGSNKILASHDTLFGIQTDSNIAQTIDPKTIAEGDSTNIIFQDSGSSNIVISNEIDGTTGDHKVSFG